MVLSYPDVRERVLLRVGVVGRATLSRCSAELHSMVMEIIGRCDVAQFQMLDRLEGFYGVPLPAIWSCDVVVCVFFLLFFTFC